MGILGTFRLDGVPPAPRGAPQIEVTFDIDANGILNVSAKDRGTGKEQTVTIAGSTTLDKTDVERMVRDAEMNADDDTKRKDAVEAKNNAESLVYQTEKQLQELADKVPADLKASIEPKVAALKSKVAEESPDAELLKTMTKELQEELMKIGQAAYANTGTSSPSSRWCKTRRCDRCRWSVRSSSFRWGKIVVRAHRESLGSRRLWPQFHREPSLSDILCAPGLRQFSATYPGSATCVP